MSPGYFQRVASEAATRFWINNPTLEEVDCAIEAGAVGATTNPAYCARLIDADLSHIHGIIDDAIAASTDDEAALPRVHQQAVEQVSRRFLSLYEASRGRHGFVMVQGDPRVDDDPARIVRDGLHYRGLGKNIVVKVPATLAAASAIADLVARNVPTCATGVFAVAQAVHVCGIYERAARESGNCPPFFVTHVTGIFDEYLAGVVERERIDIAPAVLAQAGCAVAREQYRILRDRNCSGRMLVGGARRTFHFTEMVGGDLDATIGWGIAQSLMEADAAVEFRIQQQLPPQILAELTEKLPDFWRGYREDALAPEEFRDYGPYVLFRNAFLTGYNRLLAEIAARRSVATASRN